MSGEFRIKWRFHHLQAVDSAGRPVGLGRALALKLDGQKKRHVEFRNAHDSGKGKSKEVAHEGDEDEEDVRAQALSPLPLPIFPGDRPRSTHSDRPQSKRSTSSSNSASNSASNSTFNSTFTLNSNLDTPPPEDLGIEYRTEARGHTPYLPLRDFKVDFETEINAAVQISIERDSLALLASQLKLTVMQVGHKVIYDEGLTNNHVRQRVIPNDPESPVNPRLGHVEVNLAEYVDAGSVTRTYLLRRSKVNAILNVCLLSYAPESALLISKCADDHYHDADLR